jgi:hypothetical protein
MQYSIPLQTVGGSAGHGPLVTSSITEFVAERSSEVIKNSGSSGAFDRISNDINQKSMLWNIP